MDFNDCIFLACENPKTIGDGYCDDNNNVPECNYDGGDCCGSCVNKEYCFTCACLDGRSDNAIDNPLIGNGYCDDSINRPECNYDGGDCCGPSVNTDFCTLCTCKSSGKRFYQIEPTFKDSELI
jgi:hypothetical protein